jgi:hypothetical protein
LIKIASDKSSLDSRNSFKLNKDKESINEKNDVVKTSDALAQNINKDAEAEINEKLLVAEGSQEDNES